MNKYDKLICQNNAEGITNFGCFISSDLEHFLVSQLHRARSQTYAYQCDPFYFVTVQNASLSKTNICGDTQKQSRQTHTIKAVVLPKELYSSYVDFNPNTKKVHPLP